MAALFNITLHSSDPIRLARFWSAALGFTVVEERPDLVRLTAAQPIDTPDLLVLRGDVPCRGGIHLDLAAADVATEIERLCSVGATVVDPGTDVGPAVRTANGITWVVLADPDGNPFCVGSLP